MQQPFPVPDDYDDGDPLADPPAPQLTPEQRAEESALAVFPGAAELDSDQWWQPPEPADGDEPDPAELAPQADAPQPRAPEPTAVAREWAAPFADDVPLEEPPAAAAPRQLWSTPEPEPAIDPEPLYAPESEPELPPPAAPAPPAAEARPIAPAATPRETDDIPRSVLSLPLRSGREQREAGGASQREAIMAQAGAAPDPAPAQSTAEAQLAVAMQNGTPAAAAAPRQSKSRFTRKIRLSLIVIILTLVSLWAGATATGQGGDIERGASALAPDVLERWISDRVSAFGNSSPAATAGVPNPLPGAPAVVGDPTLLGRIAHTGGGGVPVRSTCVPEARTPRTINEGAPVTVIAQGVGDCSGWNVVRAGATVSWVESAYVEPLSAP